MFSGTVQYECVEGYYAHHDEEDFGSGSGSGFEADGVLQYYDFMDTVVCVWDEALQDVVFDKVVQCKPVPCPELQIPDHSTFHADFDSPPINNQYLYETVITFFCNPG